MFRFVVASALSMAAAARAEGANCDNPPCLTLPVNRLIYTSDTFENDALQGTPMWRTSMTALSSNAGPTGRGQAYWHLVQPSYILNPLEQVVGKQWTVSHGWSYGVLNGGRGYWENATLATWQHGDPPQWDSYCKQSNVNIGPRDNLAFVASFTKHCGVNVACPKPFRDYWMKRAGYHYESCNCFHPEGDTKYSMWTQAHNPDFTDPQMFSIHPEAQEYDDDAGWGPSDDSTNMFIPGWHTDDDVDDRHWEQLPCKPATSEGKTALRGSAFGKGDADAEMPNLVHSDIFAQVPDAQVPEFS